MSEKLIFFNLNAYNLKIKVKHLILPMFRSNFIRRGQKVLPYTSVPMRPVSGLHISIIAVVVSKLMARIHAKSFTKEARQ